MLCHRDWCWTYHLCNLDENVRSMVNKFANGTKITGMVDNEQDYQ